MNVRNLGILSIGMLVFVVACSESEPPEPGQLRVEWRIGGKTCAQVGLEKVEVLAINSETKAAEGVVSENCTTYATIVDNLPSGTYYIKLNGYDASGRVIYEGAYPDTSQPIESIEDQLLYIPPAQIMSVPTRINLAGKPGEIYLSWYFRNGRLCSTNGVYQVNVYGYDTMSNPVVESTFPCDPMTGGYGLVPTGLGNDENPAIKSNGAVRVGGFPAGSIDLLIEGIASDGQLKFMGNMKFAIEHGELKDIEVPLEDCSVVLCNY